MMIHMEQNFAEITEGILRIIGKDEGLQEQFAKGLGIEVEQLQDYLDRVEFPVVGEKNKHDL